MQLREMVLDLAIGARVPRSRAWCPLRWGGLRSIEPIWEKIPYFQFTDIYRQSINVFHMLWDFCLDMNVAPLSTAITYFISTGILPVTNTLGSCNYRNIGTYWNCTSLYSSTYAYSRHQTTLHRRILSMMANLWWCQSSNDWISFPNPIDFPAASADLNQGVMGIAIMWNLAL